MDAQHNTMFKFRGVDPYGTGDMSPNIYERGTSMLCTPPPNILEVMSFRLGLFYTITATTFVCCILLQILCVVSQKKLHLLGDFVPRPTVFFYVPPIILLDRRPCVQYYVNVSNKYSN